MARKRGKDREAAEEDQKTGLEQNKRWGAETDTRNEREVKQRQRQRINREDSETEREKQQREIETAMWQKEHRHTLQMKGRFRIQYICMFPIDVFPEIKSAASLFPRHNYNVLSPNFHINVSVSDLCIPRIGLDSGVWLLQNRQTDPGNK